MSDTDEPAESTLWKTFRVARWVAALAVALLAVLAARHDVCHTTTTIRTGVSTPSFFPRTETTQACGGVGFPDLTGYLLAIAVLLLPDARSIGIGGFQFERLTSKVDQVSRDVGALSQTVSQTFNFGADALDQLRVGLRKQKAALDKVRGSLPSDGRTSDQLKLVDDVARRSDDAPLTEVLGAIVAAGTLIDEAQRAARAEVDRSVSVSDTDVATAQEAAQVLPDFLRSLLERDQ